jgi:hypothetical protein
MVRSAVTPVPRDQRGWVALGLVVGLTCTSTAYAQGQAAPTTRVFGSDAGMVLNFIKPDKTTDFEAIMGRLKEALQKSQKPERKQQAMSWKVFKSPEPAAGGNALYVFIVDPSVKGADYTVSNILAEGFPPDQVQALYKQYADSYASGQNFVNLTLVQDLGKP